MSVELITTDDGGWYVIQSSDDGAGYDLYGAELAFLSHHRRKWEAVEAAKYPDGRP